MALSRIPVYEVTSYARLEVSDRPHPVVSQISGRVVHNHMAIGLDVVAGQLLLELDDEAERIALDQSNVLLADLEARKRAIEEQIRSIEQALLSHRDADQAAVAEARAWIREARARLEHAEQREEERQRLHERSLATAQELRDAQAEVAVRSAEVQARQRQAEWTDLERAAAQVDRQTEMAELQRDLAAINGEIETQRVAVRRIEHEIELRRVRAPISGVLAESQESPPGSFVEEGVALATVIPPGELGVVAYYSPASAGRIHPGDPARIRFPGFPWMQYGTIGANVANVASETRSGSIRVDLSIAPQPDTQIPLQHSLPAVVEIEVERVSPFTLILRAVGGWIRGDEENEPVQTTPAAG
ncbi:MAG: HlyD family efflux transporter periplasmic adaptor subunit [Bradymonadales bacterium]|nr:HlyD family efflux transporter periplasmic adaptor subunit [Bradymonadales bacterium]